MYAFLLLISCVCFIFRPSSRPEKGGEFFLLYTVIEIFSEVRPLAIMWSFSCCFLQAVGKKSGRGWPGATGHGVSGWRPRPLKGDQLGTDLKLGEDISAANARLCPSSREPHLGLLKLPGGKATGRVLIWRSGFSSELSGC